MEQPNLIDKMNSWARRSVFLKLVAIGILILVLLIPYSRIKKLVDERSERKQEAIDKISSQWGGAQTVKGPVIAIPYKYYLKNDDGKVVESIEHAYFLPDLLKIDGNATTQTRYYGIYEATLYEAKLKLSGYFTTPSFAGLDVDKTKIMWNDAVMIMGITDMKGIQDNIEIGRDGQKYPTSSGVNMNFINSGVKTPFPLKADSQERINFNLDLNINGSQSLTFIPLGKETYVNMKSTWPDPSFSGSFLPDDRKVSDSGFTASWKVLELNRNYPQKWLGDYTVEESAFGVDFYNPVDEYQKNDRAVKYCVMFIFLTFLIFFFTEVLRKKLIHPLQYLMVGFAITLFYLILLSLSEHMKFNLAYLIAAVAIITLVSLYSKALFGANKPALIICLTITMFYGFFFSLLQLQDYALLIGSIGLFIILALVMYLSRNINWYSTGNEPKNLENQPPY